MNAALTFGLGFMVLAPRFAPDPDQPFAPSWFAWSLVLASMAFGAVVLVWWGSVRGPGRSWREVGWHLDRWPTRVGSALLGGVVIIGCVAAIRVALGDTLPQFLADLASVSLAQRLVLVAVGLGAGLVEETLFRGNLQPLFEVRLGRAGAILATSVVFALYHLNPSIPGLLGKLAVGVVCGTLRGRDGSLLGCATAHALVWVIAGLA